MLVMEATNMTTQTTVTSQSVIDAVAAKQDRGLTVRDFWFYHMSHAQRAEFGHVGGNFERACRAHVAAMKEGSHE
jgi:hypothetical protein